MKSEGAEILKFPTHEPKEFRLCGFKTQHYPLLCEWWQKHQWPQVPLRSLPVNTGFIAVKGDRPLAMGFIYPTTTDIAWMEWITVHPEASKEDRGPAIDFLLTKIVEYAERLGFHHIFTSTRPTPFVNRLVKHGFTKTDDGMQNLIRRI